MLSSSGVRWASPVPVRLLSQANGSYRWALQQRLTLCDVAGANQHLEKHGFIVYGASFSQSFGKVSGVQTKCFLSSSSLVVLVSLNYFKMVK